MQNNQLKVGTDFSGLGSPEEALKRLLVNYSVEFACEKDKYARQSYLENHNPKVFYDDVTTRDNSKAGYTDLYVFGFPCQAFSNAGKRLGFQDTRGTLFFNSLDYINQNRPRVFIAENVKGLLSHDKKKGTKGKYGNTFNTILDCLAVTANGQYNLHKYDDCVNYHVCYQVLNTKNYGIPQNRERIFIVGFRDEADAVNFRMPKPIPLLLRLKDLLQDNPDSVLVSKETRSEEGKAIRRANMKDGKDFNPYRSKEINFSESDTISTITTSLTKDHYVIPVDEKFYIDNITHRKGNFSYRENENSISGHRNDFKKSGMQEEVYHKPDGILNTLTTGHIPKLLVYQVDEKYYLSDKMVSFLTKHTENMQAKGNGFKFEPKGEDSIASCITARTAKMGVDDNYIKVPEATKQGFATAGPGDSINLSNPNSKTRRGRVGVANTLDTACSQAVVIDQLLPLFDTGKNSQGRRIYDDAGLSCTLSAQGGGLGAKTGLYRTGVRIRRLTPRECFRLQGYADYFFDNCAAIQSDTQLYKQAGNSITVDTIMHLLRNVLTAIGFVQD